MALLPRPLITAALLLAFAAPAQAIVGGTETQRDWPHMVAMEFRADGENDFSFRCGGSLVRSDVILTAAHCVDGEGTPGDPDTLPAAGFRFVVGSRDRASGGERIAAVEVVEHPDWDAGRDSHDVALVKLARPVTLGSPIRIAEDSDAGAYEPGDPATIIGWGSTVFGGDAVRMLREAQVPIVSDAECDRSYSATTTFHAPTSICAGNLTGGQDSCQGDSGGPLMVVGADGAFALVGVTSFGVGCAFPTQYGVYAEAAGAVLRPWIVTRTQELSPATAAPEPGPAPPSSEPSTGAGAGATPLPTVTLPAFLGSARRARSLGRLPFRVRTTATLTRLRASLRRGGRIVATARRAKLLGSSGRLVLRLRRPVRAGRATLRFTARDAEGRSVRVSRIVRVRR